MSCFLLPMSVKIAGEEKVETSYIHKKIQRHNVIIEKITCLQKIPIDDVMDVGSPRPPTSAIEAPPVVEFKDDEDKINELMRQEELDYLTSLVKDRRTTFGCRGLRPSRQVALQPEGLCPERPEGDLHLDSKVE